MGQWYDAFPSKRDPEGDQHTPPELLRLTHHGTGKPQWVCPAFIVSILQFDGYCKVGLRDGTSVLVGEPADHIASWREERLRIQRTKSEMTAYRVKFINTGRDLAPLGASDDSKEPESKPHCNDVDLLLTQNYCPDCGCDDDWDAREQKCAKCEKVFNTTTTNTRQKGNEVTYCHRCGGPRLNGEECRNNHDSERGYFCWECGWRLKYVETDRKWICRTCPPIEGQPVNRGQYKRCWDYPYKGLGLDIIDCSASQGESIPTTYHPRA